MMWWLLHYQCYRMLCTILLHLYFWFFWLQLFKFFDWVSSWIFCCWFLAHWISMSQACRVSHLHQPHSKHQQLLFSIAMFRLFVSSSTIFGLFVFFHNFVLCFSLYNEVSKEYYKQDNVTEYAELASSPPRQLEDLVDSNCRRLSEVKIEPKQVGRYRENGFRI